MRGILQILEDEDGYVEFEGEGHWRRNEDGIAFIEKSSI